MQLRRNEILTGLVVLATVVVLVGILILLGAPGLFKPLVTYKIYLDNAAGIKLGAPVLLAGRKIGQVERLNSPVTQEEAQRAQATADSIRPPAAAVTPTPGSIGPNTRSASMCAWTRTRAFTRMRRRVSSRSGYSARPRSILPRATKPRDAQKMDKPSRAIVFRTSADPLPRCSKSSSQLRPRTGNLKRTPDDRAEPQPDHG